MVEIKEMFWREHLKYLIQLFFGTIIVGGLCANIFFSANDKAEAAVTRCMQNETALKVLSTETSSKIDQLADIVERYIKRSDSNVAGLYAQIKEVNTSVRKTQDVVLELRVRMREYYKEELNNV